MATPITDPGVTVPTGDADSVDSSSTWMGRLSDLLDGHADRVISATQLGQEWQGEAATSFKDVSNIVAGHFRDAADTSRQTQAALKRFATLLRTCQQEAKNDLTHATHWMGQVNHWQDQLDTDQQAETTAEEDLATAEHDMALASRGPTEAGIAGAVAVEVSNAKAKLATAKQKVAEDKSKLSHAHDELDFWRGKGARALFDAEDAAAQLTHSIAPLMVVPPPILEPPAEIKAATELEQRGIDPGTADKVALAALQQRRVEAMGQVPFVLDLTTEGVKLAIDVNDPNKAGTVLGLFDKGLNVRLTAGDSTSGLKASMLALAGAAKQLGLKYDPGDQDGIENNLQQFAWAATDPVYGDAEKYLTGGTLTKKGAEEFDNFLKSGTESLSPDTLGWAPGGDLRKQDEAYNDTSGWDVSISFFDIGPTITLGVDSTGTPHAGVGLSAGLGLPVTISPYSSSLSGAGVSGCVPGACGSAGTSTGVTPGYGAGFGVGATKQIF